MSGFRLVQISMTLNERSAPVSYRARRRRVGVNEAKPLNPSTEPVGYGQRRRSYKLRVGGVVQFVEYRTRNQEVAGSTHTWFTASNLEQVANLLCA